MTIVLFLIYGGICVGIVAWGICRVFKFKRLHQVESTPLTSLTQQEIEEWDGVAQQFWETYESDLAYMGIEPYASLSGISREIGKTVFDDDCF